MIVIGANHAENAPTMPDYIPARRLLAACATEMRRQATAMDALDGALGEMLLSLRQQGDVVPGEQRLAGPLLRHLQRADHTRQEVEGIAQALSLLARTDSLEDMLASEVVLACSPVVALQHRLLAEATAPETPAIHQRPSVEP